MKKAVAVTVVILAVWAAIIAVGRAKRSGAGGPDQGLSSGLGPRGLNDEALSQLQAALASWPRESQDAAKRMIAKYGLPDETGRRRLVWNDNGPWKRTIVHREAGRDILEQVADYHVPNDRYALIGRLPGSVSAERGRDELASRAGDEALNFLALNLADEVLSGKRQLDDAQQAYTNAARLTAAGKSSPYTESLLFAEPAAPPPATGGRK